MSVDANGPRLGHESFTAPFLILIHAPRCSCPGELACRWCVSLFMSYCAVLLWTSFVPIVVVQESLRLILLTMDNVSVASVVWYMSHDVCLITGLLKDRRPEPQASACAGRGRGMKPVACAARASMQIG